MITVYLCFLAGGAVLPLASFILGSINHGFDTDAGADIDAGPDVDVNADIEMDSDIDMDADLDADADIDTGADTDLDGDNVPSAGTGSDTGLTADSGASILSIGLFPSSLMSLSALAITFGAVGGIMTLTGKGKIITFTLAVLSGYLASVVIQTTIRTLKKAQTRNYGLDENELLLYDGTVVDTILPGQLGSVSFVTLGNVRVSYPAKCIDEGVKLAAGRVVKVKEIKNGVFIVEPKNKYE